MCAGSKFVLFADDVSHHSIIRRGLPISPPKKRQNYWFISLRPGYRILDLERLTRLKTQLRKIKVFGMHSVFVFGGRN